MWQYLRTVVEERAAEEAANSFDEKFPRFEEAYEALKWILVREPDRGMYKPDSPFRLYVQAGDPLAETPSLWEVYSVTEHEITFHGIHATEAQTAH